MNKTTIISIVILLVGGLFVFNMMGKDGDQDIVLKNSSEIVTDKLTYDFGSIDIFAGKVSTEYVLTNKGEEGVTVTSAITSCMCTEGSIGGMTFGMHSGSGSIVIPAGGSETLVATYDPLAHGPNGTGKIKRELTLQTDSTVTPEIVVTFTADVYK